jgi:FkbM family methyltransferase
MSMTRIIQKAVDLIPFAARDSIRKIPGLKQFQAFLIKRWVDNKEFVAVISGGPAKSLKFPVKMPQDKQIWIGTWEIEFAQSLADNVKPGWVCFDIGGYKGYYSGVMALKGASKVVVFEPMPENTKKISTLIELNPTLPIQLVKAAVSEKTETAIFKLMPEETMGKLQNSTFQKTEKGIHEIEVQCISLDDYIAEGNATPDFMKIDVEGAEEFVLKGAAKLLQTKKPFLMIEVHSPEIGLRCLPLLDACYKHVVVAETGQRPEKGTPEICHFVAHN